MFCNAGATAKERATNMGNDTLEVYNGDVIPDTYGKTPWQLNVMPWNLGQNKAKRTGISRPGYKDRAVYEYRGAYYVYDAGLLVLSSIWHENVENVLPEHQDEFRAYRAQLTQ